MLVSARRVYVLKLRHPILKLGKKTPVLIPSLFRIKTIINFWQKSPWFNVKRPTSLSFINIPCFLRWVFCLTSEVGETPSRSHHFREDGEAFVAMVKMWAPMTETQTEKTKKRSFAAAETRGLGQCVVFSWHQKEVHRSTGSVRQLYIFIRWWNFKYFLCSPRKLGMMNPFWLIFFKWVETTNQRNNGRWAMKSLHQSGIGWDMGYVTCSNKKDLSSILGIEFVSYIMTSRCSHGFWSNSDR